MSQNYAGTEMPASTPYVKYYYMLNTLAVYVYVYLKGVEVNRLRGGIIINWSQT